MEHLLRNGKPADKNVSELRHEVWQRILQEQRARRKTRVFLALPAWTWALASLIVIMLAVVALVLLK